jgi:hypothetical protein
MDLENRYVGNQYVDDHHSGDGPEDRWTVYRTRFLVRAQQLTEPLVFTDPLGREQSGLPGDYLVETSAGVKRITAQALFEDIYVPLGVPLATAGNEVPEVSGRPVSRSAPESRVRATA